MAAAEAGGGSVAVAGVEGGLPSGVRPTVSLLAEVERVARRGLAERQKGT